MSKDVPEKEEMEKGKWYDLDPPANIQGKEFYHAQCLGPAGEDQPHTFILEGIPKGERGSECFLLHFSDKGRVRPRLSLEQEPDKKGFSREEGWPFSSGGNSIVYN